MIRDGLMQRPRCWLARGKDGSGSGFKKSVERALFPLKRHYLHL